MKAAWLVSIAIGFASPLWAQTASGLEAPYACRQDIRPQDESFPGVHVATLEEAPSGGLLYGLYAGSREGADDVKTYVSRLQTGFNEWTVPEVVFDEPGRPDGNAVLWTDDDNDRIHPFFSTITGDGWIEVNLRTITSEDDGVTWSEPRWVRKEWGWLVGTRPLPMSDGMIHLGYTHRRASMRHLVFDEAFLRRGPTLPSAGGFDGVQAYTAPEGLRIREACAYRPSPSGAGTNVE